MVETSATELHFGRSFGTYKKSLSIKFGKTSATKIYIDKSQNFRRNVLVDVWQRHWQSKVTEFLGKGNYACYEEIGRDFGRSFSSQLFKKLPNIAGGKSKGF